MINNSHKIFLNTTSTESPIWDYKYVLKDAGEQLVLEFIITTEDSSSPSLNLEIVHLSPNTSAQVVVKTLCKNKSYPKFNGLIRIEQTAHSTKSHLQHHSLILDEAGSFSLPALEILNDQVECSHCASQKTLDPNLIYYSCTRGIPENAARLMLIQAFLNTNFFNQTTN